MEGGELFKKISERNEQFTELGNKKKCCHTTLKCVMIL
jgi:hypothetical protein